MAPPTGEGCTGGAQAVRLAYAGSPASPNTISVLGSNGRTVTYTFTGSLMAGKVLACPPPSGAVYTCSGSGVFENGYTIDATAGGCSTCKLGTVVTLSVNGSVQEKFHTSCSCPDSSYGVATNLVVGNPMCLDATSGTNDSGTKGEASALWKLVGREPL